MHWLGFKFFGVIVYWTIFFIEFFEKPKLKIILEFGGVLGIVGKPHQVWFNQVDVGILRPKMWKILLKF